MTGQDSVKIRLDGTVTTVKTEEADKVSKDAAAVIHAVLTDYAYLLP